MNLDKDTHSMFLRTEEMTGPPSSLGSGLALSSLAPAWCGGEGLVDTGCTENASSQARAVDFMPDLPLSSLVRQASCPFYRWGNRLKIIEKDHTF